MTDAFWWYVLAGFLLGFSVSTLWEWLYFRRRRMTIRNQRIADLEATVRTYAAATGAPANRAADDWAEPNFQNPGVYLETEEPSPPTPRPDILPPDTPQQGENTPPARPASFVSPLANTSPLPNGAPVSTGQPAVSTPAPYPAHTGSAAPITGFQSVAVQQPPATGSAAAPAQSAAPVLATAGAATVAHGVRKDAEEGKQLSPAPPAAGAETAPAAATTTADAAPPAHAPAPVAAPVVPSQPAGEDKQPERAAPTLYVNGRGSKPDLAGSPALADEAAGEVARSVPAGAAASDTPNSKDVRIITSSEIGAMRSSINSLLDEVNHTAEATGLAATAEAAPRDAAPDDPYATRISGRTEYVLVRLVQSLVHFARQVRAILTGDEARPALHTAPASADGDDLTRIAGLNADHATRLKTAGVTTYARLAQLSPDELRMITFTPGGAAVDPAGWRQAAAQLASSEGGRP